MSLEGWAQVSLIAGNILVSTKLLGRGRLRNPIFWFLFFFSFQVAGTYPLLDLATPDDSSHGYVLLGASYVILMYLLFLYPRASLERAFQVHAARPQIPLRPQERLALIALMAVSVALSLVYYRIVGYNLFLLTISGGVDDFTSMRLAAYSGETYTGAGVFNQFKNTILPISYLALLLYHYTRRSYFKAFGVFCLSPVFLYCILGTGQRTYLVLSFLMVCIYYLNSPKLSKIVLGCFAVAGLAILGVYSVQLGRQAGGDLSSLLEQLFNRLFVSQQLGAVAGFRMLFNEPIVWGQEWLLTLAGYIPGVQGSDLSHRVHQYLFGSMRGTAPVSLWVSMYHNFGWLGVLGGTLLVMRFLQALQAFTLRQPKNAAFEMLSAALIIYGGIMVVGNPFQIINNGLLGAVAFYLVMRWVGKHHTTPSAYGRSHHAKRLYTTGR